MQTYLLILFIIALALAPLPGDFRIREICSKHQIQIATEKLNASIC